MVQEMLRALGLSESYLGFTMVAITNEFWREQVSAIDFKRRLLLFAALPEKRRGLPGRLRRVWPRLQKSAGPCNVADFKVKARSWLQSTGVRRHADRFEDHRQRSRRRHRGRRLPECAGKSLDKILLAGVPCVPRRYCRATAAARPSMTIGFPN